MEAYRKLGMVILSLLLVTLLVPSAAAQRASTTGIPTRIIVTVKPKHGSKVPTIYKEDVFVYEGTDRDGVVDWIPLEGNHAALELFVLIDDNLSGGLANPVDDLRSFVSKLPASTAVGVGYLRNGTVTIAQNISTDHAAAAKAIRIPASARGIPASPYVAVANLIAGWPVQPVRREIVFVTDGVDPLFRAGAQNPYVDQAIAAAQKGNVIVYSVFMRGSGFASANRGLAIWGQTYLGQLTKASGGEFYFMDFGSGPSITAYLEDVTEKLQHQFLLTFLAKPSGPSPRKIQLRTEVTNAVLVGPEKVYVGSSK
jgi:hypothetical protein